MFWAMLWNCRRWLLLVLVIRLCRRLTGMYGMAVLAGFSVPQSGPPGSLGPPRLLRLLMLLPGLCSGQMLLRTEAFVASA
mmetsp:Transcript_2452/g.3523  ORF Transcript_2452/g.3523 Transcript_2452/m.3523 type:complete len:80 (-) Transcript_2452:883-1122(-)